MLRRIKFFFLLFFFLTPIVWGQTSKESPHLSVGASSGFTANKVLFTPSVDQSFLIASSAGLLLRVDMEQSKSVMLGFQAELTYEKLGWEELFEEQPENAYRRTFETVLIPLMTHIRIGRKTVYGILNLGPQFGFIISDKAEQQGSNFTELQLRRYAQDLHGRFEWGLVGGTGFGIDAKRIGLFELEGRFYYGFNDLFNNRQQDPHGKSSNMTLALRLNYLIRL